MAEVSEIQSGDLLEVGQFLQENWKRRVSPDEWVASLIHPWSASRPNFGMQLRSEGRVVGVLCAIYSDQEIDGRLERFCNPHTWCVSKEHRAGSIGLVLQLLRQRGYHFTMFTPNSIVTKVFLGLRFRVLEDTLLYVPNLPVPLRRDDSAFVEVDADGISKRLEAKQRQVFEHHRSIPWLRFVAFGGREGACLVVYKRERWKRLGCARIVYISCARRFELYRGLLMRHLLVNERMATSRVEARFLQVIPRLAYRTKRLQPKLVLSRTLPDSGIVDLYSELVALDV
jgi:hypothetical protein